MSLKPDRLDEFERLPAEIRHRVESFCDQFEAALQRGEQVTAEDYLREFGENEPGYHVLLRELLLLECERRLRNQETISPDEIVVRFPNQQQVLNGLFDLAHQYARNPSSGHHIQTDGSPTLIGRYRLIRELGRGGFGTVFLALQIDSGKEVAVKIPHPAVLFTPGIRDWFVRETGVAASLNHPHIIKFIEAGDAGLVCYLATEYIAGPSLATWLADRGKPAEPSVAARLMLVLADTVHYAHSCGVLHQDLKPANVLLVNGDPHSPKLTDFGLARMADVADLSHTGLVVGTPAYMSPEQAMGPRQATTHRADIYALGAILYELLTGSPPFTEQLSFEVLHKVLTEEPKRPRSLNPHLPRALETICLKCMDKDPFKRYQTAAALAADLQNFLTGKPIAARPVGFLRRLARWCQREPMVAKLASSLLVVLLSAIAGLTYLWLQASEQARQTHEAQLQAEANFDLTRKVTADLLRVTRSPQLQVPGVRDLTLDALTRAEALHRQHLLKDDTNSAVNATLADVYLSLGNLYWVSGQEDQAKHYLEEAVRQWDRLSPEDAQKRENRSGMAQTHLLLARALEELDQPVEALASARRANVLRHSLLEEAPESDASIAGAITAHYLGELLRRTGSFKECQVLLEENLKFLAQTETEDPSHRRDFRQLRARTANTLAELHNSLGHQAESQKWWRMAYDWWKECVFLSDDAEYELKLAGCCLALSDSQASNPYLIEALPLLERVSQHYLDQLKEAPDEPIYSRMALQSNSMLVVCYCKVGQFETAMKRHCCHLDTIEKLVEGKRTNHELTFCFVRGLCDLSCMQSDSGKKESSLLNARKAASILARCQLSGFEGKEAHLMYFNNQFYVIHRLRLLGTMEEAGKLAEKALRESQQLVNEAPEKAYRWVLLSDAWFQFTKNYWYQQRLPETIAAYRKVISALQRAVDVAPAIYIFRRQLAERYIRFGRCLREFREFNEAESCFLTTRRLCPSDPLLVAQAGKEMKQLADELAGHRQQLSFAEQEQRQRCLEYSREMTTMATASEKTLK